MNDIINLIGQAIAEDIGDGDHTSLATIPEEATGKMKLLAKEDGIVAGVEIAKLVFEKIDPGLCIEVLITDGKPIKKGDLIFFVTGRCRSMLIAERTVLNFMQRLSGIATSTKDYVRQLEGTRARLLDTRKTTPNMRIFEKMAVVLGGGMNHRMGLYDMVINKYQTTDTELIYNTKLS